MGIGKKGIIFSLIAIGMSSLFLILFSGYYETPIDHRIPITSTKIIALDDALSDAFYYTDVAVQTAAYNGLEKLFQQVNTTSTYLSEFNNTYTACTLNGSGCNNSFNLTYYLEEYTNRVQVSQQIALDYQIHNFTLIDETHFSYGFRTNISFWITDPFARWNVSKVITTTVSTAGIHDPAYINISTTYNRFPAGWGGSDDIRQIYPVFILDYEWTPEVFANYYVRRQYRPSAYGPCLSDRFLGDWNAHHDYCGIESVVQPNRYEKLQNDLYPEFINFSMMDYQLLRENKFPCLPASGLPARVSILGINETLVLTTEEAARFNLESIWYWVDSLNATTAQCCRGFDTFVDDGNTTCT